MDKLISLIDTVNERFGFWVAFLILPMAGVTCYEVIMRKIFMAPTEWAFDVTIYIYGAHFILGFGYCMLYDRHVRIDVIAQQFPERLQTWLRVITFFILFLPFILSLTFAAVEYALESWLQWERGQSTWRPPLYIVKTIMPIGAFLLLIQGISNQIKDIRKLKGK